MGRLGKRSQAVTMPFPALSVWKTSNFQTTIQPPLAIEPNTLNGQFLGRISERG
jgi:hypothetical protein